MPSDCHGANLLLDLAASSCACDERDEREGLDGTRSVVAAKWCGLPDGSEGPSPEVRLIAEKTVLAPGEGTRVKVTLRNPDGLSHRYRYSAQGIAASFVQPDGSALPDRSTGSAGYSDQSLIELVPGGVATLILELGGQYLSHQGEEKKSLPPGRFAIQVRLGGLGETMLVPIEIR